VEWSYRKFICYILDVAIIIYFLPKGTNMRFSLSGLRQATVVGVICLSFFVASIAVAAKQKAFYKYLNRWIAGQLGLAKPIAPIAK
jgi:hypothetical protein